MKTSKKIVALLLCLTLALTMLTACSSSDSGSDTETTAAATTAAADETTDGVSDETGVAESTSGLTELAAGSFDGTNVIVTSIGQSADVDIADTLCSKAGLSVYTKSDIAASELNDTYTTLIIAIGGSSKGLGAAGIDENEELARAEELLDTAKELGIPVLALHTGGSARRGTLSDKFINAALPYAAGAIIVSEGDTDNLMADLLSANGIPATYIEQAADAVAVLQTVFGLEG
ncbi:MAG: DUF6305 family protein [Lachnospiraceae bacterium]|nr:DUF6305 family protein [Lachnospiraceae bacterium]